LTRPESAVLATLLLAGPAWAGRAPVQAPPLPAEHAHPTGAFTFRTPADWKVVAVADRPEVTEAWGGGMGVRFVYQPGENGLDALHITCMLERLAAPMDMEPRVRYEYDFVGGAFGPARALDSAFAVRYDKPVQGHRDWRQRSLTVVGAGHSLCASTYVPAPVWNKSAEVRALADAVLASVSLRTGR
jgi:hypothetical protein